MSLKILLADDHHLVRQAMRALLETETDHEVVGESGDGLQVMADVERLQPDLVLLDVMMPGLNGLEVARQISHRGRTRVLILSMHSNEAYVVKALQNGASGYVLKDSQAGELLQAIEEVAAGRRYLSAPLSDRAIAAYAERADATVADAYDTLTTREREVLQLAAEGYSNVEIGQRLFISPRTAETHRAHFMHKLGLKNQSDLIRFALARGILSSASGPVPSPGSSGAPFPVDPAPRPTPLAPSREDGRVEKAGQSAHEIRGGPDASTPSAAADSSGAAPSVPRATRPGLRTDVGGGPLNDSELDNKRVGRHPS